MRPEAFTTETTRLCKIAFRLLTWGGARSCVQGLKPPRRGQADPTLNLSSSSSSSLPHLLIPGRLILFGPILCLNVRPPRTDLSDCLLFFSTCPYYLRVPQIQSLLTTCPTTL